MVRFNCDHCSQEIMFPDEYVSQEKECPECGRVNVVPGSSEIRVPARSSLDFDKDEQKENSMTTRIHKGLLVSITIALWILVVQNFGILSLVSRPLRVPDKVDVSGSSVRIRGGVDVSGSSVDILGGVEVDIKKIDGKSFGIMDIDSFSPRLPVHIE